METVNKSIDISFIIPLLNAIIVGMVGLIALDAAINVTRWIITSVISRYPSTTDYTYFTIVVIALNILAYIAVGMLAGIINKGKLNRITDTVVMGVIAGAIVNLIPGNITDELVWLVWTYTDKLVLLGNPYIYFILMLLGLIFAVPLSELGVYLYIKRQGTAVNT